jgi:hypothetical protein
MGEAPLQSACCLQPSLEVVQLLIEKGAHVDGGQVSRRLITLGSTQQLTARNCSEEERLSLVHVLARIQLQLRSSC